AQEPRTPCDLFGRADHQTLSVLDGPDEVSGLDEGLKRAGIEPSGAARQNPNMQIAVLEVYAVHVGDLVLTALRRPDALGDIDHRVVVKVQARDREIALGP